MIAIINTIVSRMVLSFFGNDDDRETGLFAMLFGTSRKRKSGDGGAPKGNANTPGYGLAFLLIVIIILVLYFAIRQG